MAEQPRLPRKLVVRSPNWLGDAVMAMPALEWLRQQGDYELSILSPEKIAGLWKLLPWVKEVIFTSPSIWETAARLRAHSFEGAILLPNSLRTGLEAYLAGIPLRLGFRGHWRRLLLTHSRPRLSMKASRRHQAYDLLELVAGQNENLPEPLLPTVRIPSPPLISEPYFALCPGAEYGPAKRWPAERFAGVAKALAADGLKPVILGAGGDAPVASEIETRLEGRALNLAGRTNFESFLSYLAHAQVVICNDSGSMHVAALLGVPTIAIFGSTEPALTGPLNDCVRVVRERPECSPCFLRVCPIDFRCMLAIEENRILQLCREALSSTAS